MDLKQLYQDIILEHGKSPRNLGKCEGFNHNAKGHNPLCGDKIHVFLKLDSKKIVDSLSFEGEGCAISLASSSIMTELVKGKTILDIGSYISQTGDWCLNPGATKYTGVEIIKEFADRGIELMEKYHPGENWNIITASLEDYFKQHKEKYDSLDRNIKFEPYGDETWSGDDIEEVVKKEKKRKNKN